MQSLEGTFSDGLHRQQERQRAWLKRKSADSDNAHLQHKPRTRHRKASWQWVCALHNQLVLVVPNGLQHFKKPIVDTPTDATEWPRLSISPDMGSDGFMIYHCCNYE